MQWCGSCEFNGTSETVHMRVVSHYCLDTVFACMWTRGSRKSFCVMGDPELAFIRSILLTAHFIGGAHSSYTYEATKPLRNYLHRYKAHARNLDRTTDYLLEC